MKATLEEETIYIVGETTLHGSFKPSSVYVFETIQGDRVNCNLSADIAIESGVQIALTGVAEYDIRTFEIVSFRASSAESIQPGLTEAVADLSKRYGHYFDAIEDVEGFVRHCRT